jgi:hypothetical protein
MDLMDIVVLCLEILMICGAILLPIIIITILVNITNKKAKEKITTLEKATKRRNIYRAIFCVILVIVIIFLSNVFLITRRSNSSNRGSINSMNQQERDAFNNYFISYKGLQEGKNVKALLSRVISNLNTYHDQGEKVPTVVLFTKEDMAKELNALSMQTLEGAHYKEETDKDQYLEDIIEIRKSVLDKHSYIVKFRLGKTGIVLGIVIGDVYHLDEEEIEAVDTVLNNALHNLEEYYE